VPSHKTIHAIIDKLNLREKGISFFKLEVKLDMPYICRDTTGAMRSSLSTIKGRVGKCIFIQDCHHSTFHSPAAVDSVVPYIL